jgi:hypothetical protein
MRSFLISGIAILAAAVPAEQLTLDLHGDLLFASARKLDLIHPRLLSQLKQGATVAFDFQLALWVGDRSAVSRRAFERFVVSYDLWEERFAVTTLRKPQARATGLLAANVGTWCLQNLGLPSPKLAPADRLWVRLDVRAVENRRDVDLSSEDGLSLTSLIEVFSKGAKSGESRWILESGPISFATLRAREAERTP